MPTRIYQTKIAAPLARVWLFHTDAQNLPRLSPPAAKVRLESADLPLREGARLVILAKGPLGRPIRWVAKITECTPPNAVLFGAEARFVDEQVQGPFASWRHEHEMEAVDANTTLLTDRVTYRVPGGLLGVLADWVFVRWQLRRLFAYRRRVMRQTLA